MIAVTLILHFRDVFLCFLLQETIKDHMNMGLTIPTKFVVYGTMFDKTAGLNVAEMEFPAYFNFFVLKKRIEIYTIPRLEKCMRAVFQETLLGPISYDCAQDYAPGTPPARLVFLIL